MSETKRKLTWQERASMTVAHFGQLIIQTPGPRRIGQVVKVYEAANSLVVADQPFVVVGVATFDDFKQQTRFNGFEPMDGDFHYYKVETE